MQQSTGSKGAEAEVAAKREFARVMTPALDLVAPSGMSIDERKTWLASAFRFLGDMSIAVLESRLPAAMLIADHPSKIVAALRQVGERAARATGANYDPIPDLRPALPAPPSPPLTADEIRRTPQSIRDMGVRQGWLTQDEVDVAVAHG